MNGLAVLTDASIYESRRVRVGPRWVERRRLLGLETLAQVVVRSGRSNRLEGEKCAKRQRQHGFLVRIRPASQGRHKNQVLDPGLLGARLHFYF